MDNLTHSLVGLMLARVGLEKTTPHGVAMMVLAANAPDIDAVFWFDRLKYLEYHRSYPHAFVFMPLVALLPMLLVRARFTWTSYLASIAGVFSHLLLDWTNSYGIQLALPFSAHRFRLDMVNIFDVWIWVILLGAVAATALSRLGSHDIGEAKTAAARREWAWVALAALLVYEGGRFVIHARAVETMAVRLYEGAPPRRVTALPGAFSPFDWRGVIEGDGFVIVAPVEILAGGYDPRFARLYRTPPPVAAMEAAMRTRPFQVFGQFASLPFWRVTPVSDGLRLDLMDLRFGSPDSPGFASVSAILDGAGNVLRAGFGI
jgi:inner membrane protein